MTEPSERATADPGPGDVRPIGVLVAVCSSILFIGLNTTAMNTAIGVIAEDFSLSTSGVAWAINGYMLAAAAIVAPAGQFGDVYGRRKMFAIGLAVFALGSITVAAGPGAGFLVLGRGLQGAGSALLLPAQLAIIRLVFPPERQGFAVGIWAAVASLTFAIGPLYGGLFADTVGWRWMFAVDLVFITATAILSMRFLRPLEESTTRVRPDFLGAVLLGAAILLSVLALQQGPVWGWTSPGVIASMVAAPVLLVLFWIVEHRVEHPIVHFPLFRLLPYTGGAVTTFAQGFGMMGFLYLLGNYVESFAIYDYSALDAGFVLFPGGAVMFVGALLGGRWADRAGYRIPNTASMALIALGSLLYLLTDRSSGVVVLAAISCVGAAGIGVAFSTTSASGMAAVPAEVGGEAAGIINAARYIGVVFVVAIGTIVGTAFAVERLDGDLADVGASAAEQVDLDDSMRESSADLRKTVEGAPEAERDSILTAVQDATSVGFKASQALVAFVTALAAAAAWILFRSEDEELQADERDPV